MNIHNILNINYKKIFASIFNILILFSVFAVETDYTTLLIPDSKISEISPEEHEYLNTNPEITVVSNPDWKPFEYYVNTIDIPQFAGINYALLKKIGKKSGITFKFITTKSYPESVSCFISNHADILSGYSREALYHTNYNATYSNNIYSIPMILISKYNHYPHNGDRIIINGYNDVLIDKINKNIKRDNINLVSAVNLKDSFALLQKNEGDYILINKYDLENIKLPRYYNVFETDITYDFSFAFSKNIAPEAVSLINKAIDLISTEEFNAIIYSCLAEKRYFDHEETIRAKSSKVSAVCIIISFSILGLIIFFIYLVSKKRKPYMIDHDETTGIPSFTKFKHDVRQKLKTAMPNEYFILSLDIDNFSFINDSYGFNTGNVLLIELSQQFFEECKQNDFYICRFYADNFLIFGKNPGFVGLIEEYVFRLTNNLDSIKSLLPEDYELTFSSGVYYITDTHLDVSVMVDNANIARRFGKNTQMTHRITEYTQQMDEESQLKKSITLSMNRAIDNGEFEVYFQPKFRFSDSVVIGAEALIRWNNPEQGFMNPGSFIPLFEHNGFIQKLDLFVFEQVCKFIHTWNSSGEDGKCPHPITISFNLSRFHLFNPNLLRELSSIAKQYTIFPCQLEVELTETVMFDNKKKLIHTMNQLKEAGFRISVDDFGSGYSSLNLLKDMPADVLKLDKEFLSTAQDNEKESIIINSVIDMAKKLKITTVAEGVETKRQSDLLKNIGCDIVQGFYYSKPIKEEEFRNLLEKSFL